MNLERMLQQAAVAQPQQPQVALSLPFNDAQLLAMVAVHIDAPTLKKQVEAAVEIVAESVVAVNTGALGRMIEAKRKRLMESSV